MRIVSVILVCCTMFENFSFCIIERTTESYSIHLFDILFEIYFYSTMKKRTQIEQIGGRTWMVYSCHSQGYNCQQPAFRQFSSDRITTGRVFHLRSFYFLQVQNR